MKRGNIVPFFYLDAMKALLIVSSFFFFALQLQAQEKMVFRQFYQFKSTCNFIYTTNKSSILTLYTDSSFLLETFSNKRGKEQLYTRISFSGKWQMKNDTAFFQYLNRDLNSVTGDGRSVFTSDIVFANEIPTACLVKEDMLFTNTVSMDNFHIAKGKPFAIGEKWAYENALRLANSLKKKLLLVN